MHLKGRETQLNTVTQAIYAAGRHVFVHGERGVGKTSLAKTAARAAASNSECFRQIGCSTDSSFDDLIRQVVEVFSPGRLAAVQKSSNWSFTYFLGIGKNHQESYAAPSKISVSNAADMLASLDDDGSNTLRVVVIDEIDRLQLLETKTQFAELVKLLGDRGARISLIFTGVGDDLEKILGSHPSSFRQLAQVPLDRLDYQSALDIVDDALEKFGLSWEVEPTRTARFRIASIANGFPYYVHLLLEKLLYQVYEDKDATGITLDHLQRAIAAAVRDAQEEIRKPYDMATRGRNDSYKLGVWAAADSWSLERTAAQIYASYAALCERMSIAPLDNKKFLQILAALKRSGYGPIFRAGYRKGLYQFTENIVRGYVRLCAAAEGIELQDLRPDDAARPVIFGREKRYIDPRRLGGPPSLLIRR